MEFYEKLQKLRKEQNLTQEEIAEKLFVSRTAISKWKSGRGYPSIDSLKVIAKYFHISIDELIGGEEIVTLAEQDIKEKNRKHTALICGVLDCFVALLFFLPLFGNGDSSGCGFPNSKHNFEPAVMQFERCFPNEHTMITVPESPMFNAPEAAVVTVPRLELVKMAGKQYAESGIIDEELLKEITSPMIPEEQYTEIVNGSM